MWDTYGEVFRWIPDETKGAVKSVNPWVDHYDNGVIRMEEEYAKNNLTSEALGYSYKLEDGYYYWNMEDSSVYPVVFEMPRIFFDIGDEPNFDELLEWLHHTMQYLNLYPSYVEKHCNKQIPELYEIYKENYLKTYWTPDNKEGK